MSNFDIIMISGFKKRFVILGIPFYYFSAASRTRFSDIAISRNRNGMQQNTVRGNFIATKAIAFSPAFSVRRRFTATKQQSQPHQWLNDIEQGGIQQFQAIIRLFSFGGQILSIWAR